MKEWIKKQLNNRSYTIPVLTFPSAQLLNVSVDELVHSGKLQAEGMKKISERCPMSASLTMMDLSLEAEAFGSTIKFSEDEVPTVIGHILNDIEDAKDLKVPEVGTKRTKESLKAVELAKELITDRPIFAGVTGPFSLAGRLMDMTEIMVNCYIDPDYVHITLEKVTEFLINYIKEFKARGADGVVMAEPASGLLSDDLCEEFSTVYVKKIKDAVDSEDFIFVYHNCGNVVPLIDSILSIGADCYHFGNAIDIEEVLKKVPSDVVVMGNIDPVSEFCYGTVDSIKASTLKLLGLTKQYPNFVVSSGCDIPAKSSWDNIDAYFEVVNGFYKEG